MANIPKVVLAKELGQCYACAGIIANMCTGLIEEEATGEEIVGIVDMKKENKKKDNIDKCDCKNPLIRV